MENPLPLKRVQPRGALMSMGLFAALASYWFTPVLTVWLGLLRFQTPEATSFAV